MSNYISTITHFHWSSINDKATGVVCSTWESQLASVAFIDRRPLLYFETRESRQSNRDSLNTRLPDNKPFTIWHSPSFPFFLHPFCVLCLLKTTLPIWLKFSCYAFQKAKFHIIFSLLFNFVFMLYVGMGKQRGHPVPCWFSTRLYIAGPFCKLCRTRRRSPYHWVASVTWNPRKQRRYTVMTWALKFTKIPFSSRYKYF